MENIKIEIEKISKNHPSFLGIDGGNIKSDYWFCGIEFGGDIEEMSKYLTEYVKSYPYNNHQIPYRTDCPDRFMRSTYDRFLSALYINLFLEPLNKIEDTGKINQILKDELYNQNSKLFKLNLFPLAKKNTAWDIRITKNLGVDKKVYYNEIFSNRQSFLKELIKQEKPKYLICTSTEEYRSAFIQTFVDKDQSTPDQWTLLDSSNGTKIKIEEFRIEETTLIIIPFLGRGNLNSYNSVLTTANYLKSKYT